MKKEDTAMFEESLPCNSRPFLRRMDEILSEAKCTNPRDLEDEQKNYFLSNLWIIMYQAFGKQLGDINMYELWTNLSKEMKDVI